MNDTIKPDLINEPGFYQMSAEQYHADPCATPSLSNSIAKILILQSPIHAWLQHSRLNPDYESRESDTFDIGSAAHALVLEGVDRMEVIKFDSYRTNAAKDLRDAARLVGKHPIIEAKAQDLLRMVPMARAALNECADFGYAWEDGKPEQTLIWKDRGGIFCRARPDWLSNDLSTMLDYKTTTDATPGVFTKQIARMNYHIQASFYRRGLSALTGVESKFVFEAQEIKAPFEVSFHGVAPSLEAIADDLVEGAIVRFAQCMRSNIWPGYSKRIHYAEAMPWQVSEHETEVEELIAFDMGKMFDKADK